MLFIFNLKRLCKIKENGCLQINFLCEIEAWPILFLLHGLVFYIAGHFFAFLHCNPNTTQLL